jgi:phosphatidylserine decarboxylase
MKFAREGYAYITLACIVAITVQQFAFRTGHWALWVLAAILFVIAGWVAWFFRNPTRTGPRGDDVVIAPADGRVVLIRHVQEPSFVQGPTVCVSIFMNIFSVHVNRYPVNGIVRFVEHKAGKFLNAITEQSSLENEQASVGIETSAGRILVRQIAGLIARRIITDSKAGDHAEQGARFGLIQFGSRVDVFLPPTAELQVKLGDHTQAGATVIARLGAASHNGATA